MVDENKIVYNNVIVWDDQLYKYKYIYFFIYIHMNDNFKSSNICLLNCIQENRFGVTKYKILHPIASIIRV